MANQQKQETNDRNKESKRTDGSGPGSSGAQSVRVHSHTPENRTGEMNPSAPTESTEGPSTNLATSDAARNPEFDRSRGEPARGENQTNEGNVKKPSAEKHDAA
jgi:hypothetical protein